MSGRKAAFGVYKRYIANMATKILTTDQKIYLILSKVSGLEKNQNNLEKNQATMQKDLDSLKRDITDLVDMATNTLQLAAKTADRVDKIESHLSSKTGFTPFTSGAFVA